MKKIFSIITFLLMVPFLVNAEDVEVKKIEVLGNGESSFNGDNINLASEFNDINDTVTYKITLENKENSDVDISFDIPDNKYVAYDNDIPLNIKSGEEKDIIISLKYSNLPDFHNNTFEDINTLTLGIKEVVAVPNTVDNKILLFMGILLICSSVYGILIIKYKKKMYYSLFLLVPVIAMGSFLLKDYSYALKVININSKMVFNSKDKFIKEDIIFDTDVNENEILDTGDIIRIGTEKFYVISNTSNIKALSMYNLNAGGDYNTVSLTYTPYENPTYMQDALMNSTNEFNVKNGSISYGSTNAYANSNLVAILTKYKNNLLEIAQIDAVRLITKDELEALGCSEASHSCLGIYDFVSSTSYWAYPAASATRAYEITKGGYLNASKVDSTYSGIRCVIEF